MMQSTCNYDVNLCLVYMHMYDLTELHSYSTLTAQPLMYIITSYTNEV